MPRVSCPDCSHQVSPDEVEVCPQCGYPIRAVYYGHHARQEEEIPPSPPSPERVPSVGGIVRRVLGVGCVLALVLLAGAALLVALLISSILKQG
jgi:hypothetical protein